MSADAGCSHDPQEDPDFVPKPLMTSRDTMQLSKSVVFQKRIPAAQIPKRATEGSAGYDLWALHGKMIPARGQAVVETGIKILKFPTNCYGRLASRSSLAAHHGILVAAGVIDPDFNGEVQVVLFNHTDEAYYVSGREKIAQIIFERFTHPRIFMKRKFGEMLTEVVDEPVLKKRMGGFGSTDE